MIPGHSRSIGDHEDEIGSRRSLKNLERHPSAVGDSVFCWLSGILFGLPMMLSAIGVIRDVLDNRPIDRGDVLFTVVFGLGLVWAVTSIFTVRKQGRDVRRRKKKDQWHYTSASSHIDFRGSG